MTEKKIIATGLIFGGLSVVAGAFGAHGLKPFLPSDQMQVFETAVRYQFYHGLALISTGLLAKNFSSKYFNTAAGCFIAGILLFSGSLYFLSTSSLFGLQMHWIGAVTPIGGLLMITGWILLLVGILRSSP